MQRNQVPELAARDTRTNITNIVFQDGTSLHEDTVMQDAGTDPASQQDDKNSQTITPSSVPTPFQTQTPNDETVGRNKNNSIDSPASTNSKIPSTFQSDLTSNPLQQSKIETTTPLLSAFPPNPYAPVEETWSTHIWNHNTWKASEVVETGTAAATKMFDEVMPRDDGNDIDLDGMEWNFESGVFGRRDDRRNGEEDGVKSTNGGSGKVGGEKVGDDDEKGAGDAQRSSGGVREAEDEGCMAADTAADTAAATTATAAGEKNIPYRTQQQGQGSNEPIIPCLSLLTLSSSSSSETKLDTNNTSDTDNKTTVNSKTKPGTSHKSTKRKQKQKKLQSTTTNNNNLNTKPDTIPPRPILSPPPLVSYPPPPPPSSSTSTRLPHVHLPHILTSPSDLSPSIFADMNKAMRFPPPRSPIENAIFCTGRLHTLECGHEVEKNEIQKCRSNCWNAWEVDGGVEGVFGCVLCRRERLRKEGRDGKEGDDGERGKAEGQDEADFECGDDNTEDGDEDDGNGVVTLSDEDDIIGWAQSA